MREHELHTPDQATVPNVPSCMNSPKHHQDFGWQCSFNEIASAKSEKSRAEKGHKVLDLKWYHVKRWINMNGGKEKTWFEKPYLSNDRSKHNLDIHNKCWHWSKVVLLLCISRRSGFWWKDISQMNKSTQDSWMSLIQPSLPFQPWYQPNAKGTGNGGSYIQKMTQHSYSVTYRNWSQSLLTLMTKFWCLPHILICSLLTEWKESDCWPVRTWMHGRQEK